MKTLSLAAVSSAVLFTSSFALADPRPGPEPFWAHDRFHHHHGRPFAVPASPLMRVLPHAVLPAPVVVAPRRGMAVAHPSPSPVVTPAPPPAPTQPKPQPTTNPKPDKPQPPSGQGSGGNKPPKPAR